MTLTDSSARPPRRRATRLALGGAAAVLVLVATAGLGAHVWLGSADMRARIGREASAALGAPVSLAQSGLSWLPVPALALRGLEVATPRPLRVGEVRVVPRWSSLLGGSLTLDRVEIRDADIAQTAVTQLQDAMARAARQRAGQPPTPGDAGGAPLVAVRELRLRQVRWTAQAGWSSTLDASVELAPPRSATEAAADPISPWLPVRAQAEVSAGRWQGTQLRLSPATDAAPAEGARLERRWQVDARVGGGTITGPLTLTRQAKAWRVQGELATQGVEVSALTAPQRPLSGKLEARTTLSGDAPALAGMADTLGTQTRFTVRQAVLNGIDLSRAVVTVGLSRGGQTGFDTITGQVSTRGRAVALREVVAGSALLSARADVNISASQALSGKVVVDVASGAAGVPLVLGGTVAEPEVSLSRSGLVGAALGTAVLPGVGTGVGARLGDRIGEGVKGLFGK